MWSTVIKIPAAELKSQSSLYQAVKPKLPWKQKMSRKTRDAFQSHKPSGQGLHGWRNVPNNVRYRIGLDRLYVGIILVMQRLRMVYHGVSQELLALYWYTNEPSGTYVYQENHNASTSGRLGRKPPGSCIYCYSLLTRYIELPYGVY